MRALLTILALHFAGCAPAAPPTLAVWPYKDVTQGISTADPLIARTAWEGKASDSAPLTWAFATGECGQERWGDFDTLKFAALNVAAFERAGRDFVLSVGGEAGGFICDSDEGMERFVSRYASPRLLGLDFDIERDQTAAQIDSLVLRAQFAQQVRPSLRISFTIATHASGDGSMRSLNATGELVLKSLAAAKFDRALINLMVMNYGPADARWCLLDAHTKQCDMGRSALQAARNVSRKYGIPMHRIELTPMLGENDVKGNVFTLADVRTMVLGAHQMGLAGVHYWSLDRDQPCAAGEPRVSPRCHALDGVAAGAFAASFERWRKSKAK